MGADSSALYKDVLRFDKPDFPSNTGCISCNIWYICSSVKLFSTFRNFWVWEQSLLSQSFVVNTISEMFVCENENIWYFFYTHIAFWRLYISSNKVSSQSLNICFMAEITVTFSCERYYFLNNGYLYWYTLKQICWHLTLNSCYTIQLKNQVHCSHYQKTFFYSM